MGGKNQTDVDLVSGIQIPVNTISGTGSGLITVRRPAPRTYSSTDSVTSDSHVSAAEHEYRRIESVYNPPKTNYPNSTFHGHC